MSAHFKEADFGKKIHSLIFISQKQPFSTLLAFLLSMFRNNMLILLFLDSSVLNIIHVVLTMPDVDSPLLYLLTYLYHIFLLNLYLAFTLP